MYLLSTTSNPKFALDIAHYLGEELVPCAIERFHNGEVRIHDIGRSMRGQDVFIIFSVGPNINDELVEALLLAHTCKGASAKTVTLIMPFYPYARQDKKSHGREPISAKWVADVIEKSHVDKIMTVDLHNGTIQGMTGCSFDNLTSIPIFAEYIDENIIQPHIVNGGSKNDFVIISPDAGGTERAKNLANRLGGLAMAIMYKSRPSPGEISTIKLLGEVEGKIAIIVDDMVDTCGTLKKASEELATQVKEYKGGPPIIYAFATHAPLSKDALKNITESALTALYVTDTVNLEDKLDRCTKIQCISATRLMATAILCYHEAESISDILNMPSADLDKKLEDYKTTSKQSFRDRIGLIEKENSRLKENNIILETKLNEVVSMVVSMIARTETSDKFYKNRERVSVLKNL